MAEESTTGRQAAVRPAPPRRDGGPRRPERDAAAARAFRVAVRVAAVVAGLAVLWLAHGVLLLGFLAVLVAIVLSFPVSLCARVMPRSAATLLVLATLLGAFAGVGALTAPTLSREAAQLRETVPRVARDVRNRIARVQAEATGAPLAPAPAPAPPQPPEAMAEAGARAVSAAFDVVVGLTKVILVVVLAAFLVHRPDAYQRGLRRLVPSEHEEAYDEAWARVRDALRRWVGGIMVAMLVMGTLTAIGLLAIGLEDWLLLGFLTFLGTFVPYVGAVASAVPGLLVALGESPRHFALALLVYVGVHVVEGYIVEPVIMRRAVQIRPALLLFGQGVFGAIFGALGFIVATPLIVCGQILVGYLWVERRLGKTVH
ncbi:MAG TPA: AI-2E family transporter [Anaeromyxobacter sp.]|nr:AI-2E family transporter [Anaeromyxobacter sp.]